MINFKEKIHENRFLLKGIFAFVVGGVVVYSLVEGYNKYIPRPTRQEFREQREISIQRDVNTLFEVLDKNEDGYLDRDELRNYVKKVRESRGYIDHP